jgi:hypothetical protein
VAFSTQLEEEIVTKNYIARHADLTSSDDDSIPSDTEDSLSTKTHGTESGVAKDVEEVDEASALRRSKRKSRTVLHLSDAEERGRVVRSTSSERRTKRKKRRWEWTVDSVTTIGVSSETTSIHSPSQKEATDNSQQPDAGHSVDEVVEATGNQD